MRVEFFSILGTEKEAKNSLSAINFGYAQEKSRLFPLLN
jgi:hypothetical protein